MHFIKELLTLMNSSTSASETSENIFLFVFISLFISFGVCIFVQTDDIY